MSPEGTGVVLGSSGRHWDATGEYWGCIGKLWDCHWYIHGRYWLALGSFVGHWDVRGNTGVVLGDSQKLCVSMDCSWGGLDRYQEAL